MTNFEWIKLMNAEEFGTRFCDGNLKDLICPFGDSYHYCEENEVDSCLSCAIRWLNEEHKEEDENAVQ